MPSPPPLQKGVFYHIYNRGNNGENIFRERRNYYFFMQHYAKYIKPIADTYAYALLKNHFHFLIRTKTEIEQRLAHAGKEFKILSPSQQFSNLFNSYARAFNKTYDRTGSLFEHPFKRIAVESDAYFRQLVIYIHQNPQRHGLIADFKDWSYTSYQALLSKEATSLERDVVLEWFDGVDGFIEFHQAQEAPEFETFDYVKP